MSRYTIEKEKELVAYGFDNTLGYFFDVFSLDEDGEIDKHIIEECSLITKASNSKIAMLIEKYKGNPNHVDNVMLDLPI